MKIIFAINAGSSSLKISVYSAEDRNATPRQIAHAQVSGLTSQSTKLTYLRGDESIYKNHQVTAGNQDDAFGIILDTLVGDEKLDEIGSKSDIAITCHRIVHGGKYESAQIITKDTYHHIKTLSDLAPLHNGAALGIVESCMRKLSDTTNIACFDTQFHMSLPPHVYTYPINQERAQKNGLRKYGFHGLSYSFITRSIAKFLQKDVSKLNIIALHLGSGASACAIKGGKSWDTSMGLTPLSGLPGATRSGSVDPR
jgi:acetate kinase